jgi:hypothetical protein
MAYGVTSTSVLLSLGIPPASASASVHTSEVFTTLTSGLSHLKLKNVDKNLFKKLLIPGMIGGALGAYILTFVPTKIIKPLAGVYLLIMGILILRKLFQRKETKLKTNITLLGGIGGFLDAVGGGGWGPVVTSTLVARGDKPRLTIGSVNLAWNSLLGNNPRSNHRRSHSCPICSLHLQKTTASDIAGNRWNSDNSTEHKKSLLNSNLKPEKQNTCQLRENKSAR